MTATISGVKLSDQLAALVDHAQAHGFRVEADTRPKRSGGLIAYPPNKEIPPLSFSEKGARFNRSHYENLRREFYRAGCPPLPGEIAGQRVIGAGYETEEDAKRAHEEAGHVAVSIDSLGTDLADAESGTDVLGAIIMGLMSSAQVGDAEARLVSSVAELTYSWVQRFGTDRMAEAEERAAKQVTAALQKEVNDALALASDAEARAVAADRAVDKAKAAEKKARDDCGAALRRAEAAEAKARELEAAIAPLRALLGKAQG
jgi:hypothetical protein